MMMLIKMMMLSFFELFIVATILFIGIGLLAKKFGAKVWLIPLFLAVLLGGLMIVKPSPRRVAPVHGITSNHPVGWTSNRPPTIWQEGIDHQFTSDGDPSTKPWLDHLPGYLNQHPQQDLEVAYSYDGCTHQAEAHAQALQHARQILEQRVAPLALPQNYDLDQSGIIQDRFTQRLHGSTSDIWRSALLLDLSSDKIKAITESLQAQVSLTRRTWTRQLGSGLGLAFVLFLLYLFLNAATRGYYTISLRIATAVLVVAGIAIVVWVF